MPFVYVAGMWMAVLAVGDRFHSPSMPSGWRRLSSCPMRSPPPNWCCSASSICPRWMAAAAAAMNSAPLATISLVAREMEKALGKDRNGET